MRESNRGLRQFLKQRKLGLSRLPQTGGSVLLLQEQRAHLDATEGIRPTRQSQSVQSQPVGKEEVDSGAIRAHSLQIQPTFGAVHD